jgi:hypothetical protein
MYLKIYRSDRRAILKADAHTVGGLFWKNIMTTCMIYITSNGWFAADAYISPNSRIMKCVSPFSTNYISAMKATYDGLY